MNYANRKWWGGYDDDQTGSVIGYLKEFLKKHPYLVANNDAFYGKKGYLNGMYFNGSCIESLENPKNGFFVKETNLTSEQRKNVMEDLAKLHNDPKATSEALIVVDTVLFGMNTKEYKGHNPYSPSYINNIGFYDEYRSMKHQRIAYDDEDKIKKDGKGNIEKKNISFSECFDEYVDRTRADYDKWKEEENKKKEEAEKPKTKTEYVVAETKVPVKKMVDVQEEVDGDTLHVYSDTAYERAHARLNGEVYRNVKMKPVYKDKKVRAQMLANIESLDLPAGKEKKSNAEIYLYKMAQTNRLATDRDAITVGGEKTTFGAHLKGEDGCTFKELETLLQKKELTEDEKKRIRTTMERLEPMVNDDGKFLKAVPGSKGKMSYLPEGERNFEEVTEKKTITTQKEVTDYETRQTIYKISGTDEERASKIAQIKAKLEAENPKGKVLYTGDKNPKEDESVRREHPKINPNAPIDNTFDGENSEQSHDGATPPPHGSRPNNGTPPPHDGATPPPHGSKPNNGTPPPHDGATPPPHGSKPNDGTPPPHDGATPPPHGSRPNNGTPPPHDGATPPPHGSRPNNGTPPPHDGATSPDSEASHQPRGASNVLAGAATPVPEHTEDGSQPTPDPHAAEL